MENVSPRAFLRAAESREVGEKFVFRQDRWFYYLDCYGMKDGHLGFTKMWSKRTHRSGLPPGAAADFYQRSTNEWSNPFGTKGITQ